MTAPDDHQHHDRPAHDRRGDDLPLDPPPRQPPASQPADPGDLAAFPPRDETCARIRNLLRDFVDAELAAADVAKVESHVHECRSCALALSRAESELMQIRTALGEVDRAGLRPPAGFMDRVMHGVREVATAQPTVGFTQRVMARVREESLADAVRAPRVRRMQIYLALAAGVLLATLVVVLAGDTTEPAAIEVVSAERAERIRDGVAMPLVPSDHWTAAEVRAADEFVTGAGGALTLACGSRGRAVAIEAIEDTVLCVDRAGVDPVIGLRRGEIVVGAEAAATVALGDGSAVRIGAGRMSVAVEDVRYVDTRPVLRVTILVEAGTAQVVRGARRVRVAAGHEATYTTFSVVAVGPAPSAALFAASKRRAAVLVTDPAATGDRRDRFFGQILDPRTETPIPGVSVTVETWLGTQTLTTNADGLFQVTDLDALRGQFVVVAAVPPVGEDDLAPLAPLPVAVDQRAGPGVPHRFFLGRSRSLRGRVHSAGGPIAGLWLQPCRVDEQFGIVVPLGSRQRVDARGDFRFNGLPEEQRPLQSLVLVAGSDGPAGIAPQVVWTRAAVRAEDAALDLALPAAAATRVSGFGPHATVHVLQAVRGLPLAGAARALRLRADAAGVVDLDLGAPVYRLDADRPPQRIVVTDGVAGFVTERMPQAIATLRVGSLPQRRVRWFRTDARPLVAALPARGVSVSVFERTSGQACPGTWLFLRPAGSADGGSADRALRFLGVFDGRASLQCAGDAAGQVFARTPEGWIGAIELTGTPSRPQKSIAVERAGRILWQGPATSGVLVLERVHADSSTTPIVRMATEREWTVAPGTYRFGDRQFVLEPESTIRLQ